MAEIKSTLDLVMEKTKNLNLSREEKNEQADKEIQGKLNGLLQKYKDGFLVREKLERELATIQKQYGIKVESTFKKVILERLYPGEMDSSLLVLLEKVCKANTKPIESIIKEYQNTVKALTRQRMSEVVETLDREHFISGSAVVPNLESDEQLKVEMKAVQSKFAQDLNRAKTELNAPEIKT